MSMPLHRHLFPLVVCPPQVCSSRLVMGDDLVVRGLFPLGRANEMLRRDQGIAQEQRVTHHLNVSFGGEIDEFGIVDLGVVNLRVVSNESTILSPELRNLVN